MHAPRVTFMLLSLLLLNRSVIADDITDRLSKSWSTTMRRLVEAKAVTAIVGDAPSLSPITHSSVERFLGTVEGATGVEVPPQWEQTIRNAQLSGSDIVFLRAKNDRHGRDFSEDIELGHLKPVNSDARHYLRNGDSYAFSANGVFTLATKDRPLPVTQFGPVRQHEGCVIIESFATDSKEQIIVCAHTPLMTQYDIWLIDIDNETCRWHASLCGDRTSYGGHTCYHDINVMSIPEIIYVFGATRSNAYIRALRRVDGQVIGEFDSDKYPLELTPGIQRGQE